MTASWSIGRSFESDQGFGLDLFWPDVHDESRKFQTDERMTRWSFAAGEVERGGCLGVVRYREIHDPFNKIELIRKDKVSL